MANNRANKFIVRQPIKNLVGEVVGYEIRYTGENSGYDTESGQDFAAAEAIYNFLTQNTEKSFKGALNFMTFTTNLLMKQSPKLFATEELVIQIDESVIIHPLARRFVERYRQEGYKVAVKDFKFVPRYVENLNMFDYIKLDIREEEGSLRNIIGMAHGMGKKCIAVNVDDEDLYQKVFMLDVDAMGGRYVAENMFTAVHSSNYLQSNFFRLLVAITQDEPSVEEIEQIISMDATLTYSLLRIVNSAYFALRNRATTIHQAVTILGLGQLRQWIYLMGCSKDDGELDGAQEEMLKLSFTRATFACELMKYAKDMPINRNDAYLLGMFSTLPFLIAAPMEDILSEVPISLEVKDALLNHEGRCGLLYDLILGYERADWPAINRLGEELHLPMDRLPGIYFQCLDEVNGIWKQLTEVSPAMKD